MKCHLFSWAQFLVFVAYWVLCRVPVRTGVTPQGYLTGANVSVNPPSLRPDGRSSFFAPATSHLTSLRLLEHSPSRQHPTPCPLGWRSRLPVAARWRSRSLRRERCRKRALARRLGNRRGNKHAVAPVCLPVPAQQQSLSGVGLERLPPSPPSPLPPPPGRVRLPSDKGIYDPQDDKPDRGFCNTERDLRMPPFLHILPRRPPSLSHRPPVFTLEVFQLTTLLALNFFRWLPGRGGGNVERRTPHVCASSSLFSRLFF